MGNPYTPIRRLAQALLAEVQGILAEVTLLELQEVGVRVLDPVIVESTPMPVSAFNASALKAPRRGRRPKAIEAPPLRPSSPANCCPDPDGEGLLENPVSRGPASSLPREGNTRATLKKFLQTDPSNLEKSSINAGSPANSQR